MDPVSAMSRVVGPLPAGMPAPKTEGERALYEQAKQFEAVFVRQLVSQMLEASRGESETAGLAGLPGHGGRADDREPRRQRLVRARRRGLRLPPHAGELRRSGDDGHGRRADAADPADEAEAS